MFRIILVFSKFNSGNILSALKKLIPLFSGADVKRPLTKISHNKIQTYRRFIIRVTFGSFSNWKRFWDWYFSKSIFLFETVFHEAKLLWLVPDKRYIFQPLDYNRWSWWKTLTGSVSISFFGFNIQSTSHHIYAYKIISKEFPFAVMGFSNYDLHVFKVCKVAAFNQILYIYIYIIWDILVWFMSKWISIRSF